MSRRILHVVPAIAPRYGGPSAVVLATCRALQQAGASPCIATTDADGTGRLRVAIGRPTAIEGVPVVFFRRFLGESFKWSAGMSRWLRRHAATFDVVDVHALFSHSSLAAGQACRRAGVPYVVRPHGMLDPWSLGQKALRKRLLFDAAVKHLLAGAAAMQYTTVAEQRLAEAGRPWLPRGTVVPLGVDDDLFAPAPSDDDPPDPYVLSLSRLDAKKGLEVLIQAFHAASQEPGLARWRLVLAGGGEAAYVESLRRLAHTGVARDRITFAGWVEGETKHALLRGASLFAAPSYQENFGVSVAEAMACGVPVVVAPGVNLAEEIEGAGAGWVVSRDLAAFQEALALAAGRPIERRRRGAAARRLAERFRWSVSAARLLELYDRVQAVHVPVDARLAGNRGLS